MPLYDGKRPDRDAAFSHARGGEALGRIVAHVEGIGHHVPDRSEVPAVDGVLATSAEFVGPLPGPGAPELAHLGLQTAAPPALLRDELEDRGDEASDVAVDAHPAGLATVEHVPVGHVALYEAARREPVPFGMQGPHVRQLGLQVLEVRPHVAAQRVEAARAVHEAQAHGHEHLLDVEARLREARREHRDVRHDHAVGPAVLDGAHELVEGRAHVANGVAVAYGLGLAQVVMSCQPRLARRGLRRHVGRAEPAAHPVVRGQVHGAAPLPVPARAGDPARRRQHVRKLEARHHATSCFAARSATGSPNRKTTSTSPPSPTSTLSMSSTTITRSRPAASR